MCQLTLVNLRNKELNRIFLPTLLQLNSQGNQDGTGFLCVNEDDIELYKSKDAADDLPDLGLDIRERVLSNYPVIGHVRAASKGIVVTEENAHPFQGKRFTLAHNGRLYKKEEVVRWSNTTDDTGLASDSLVFLNALDAEAEKNPDAPFLDILNSTMSQFKGKFALLIYDSLKDKHYVARGSTADLHIVTIADFPLEGGDGNPLGFIVNTKKNTLADAIVISNQIAQSVTGLRVGAGKIEELPKETVFEVVDGTLIKLGEIKENAVTYTYENPIQKAVSNYVSGASQVNTTLSIWKLSERINKFMGDHFLGITDIDALFYIFLGVGIADSNLSDLDIFCECVIPKISANKKIKKRMGDILDKYGQVYPNMYKNVKGLSYPWMLSSPDKIQELIKALEKFNKKGAKG